LVGIEGFAKKLLSISLKVNLALSILHRFCKSADQTFDHEPEPEEVEEMKYTKECPEDSHDTNSTKYKLS
jgi:hypothetical protein